MEELELTMERIRSRLATTGLMVAASLKVHVTMGVSSLPVRGARHAGDLHNVGNVATWRTSAATSRSELVIRPEGLAKLTRSAWISVGHWRHQT